MTKKKYADSVGGAAEEITDDDKKPVPGMREDGTLSPNLLFAHLCGTLPDKEIAERFNDALRVLRFKRKSPFTAADIAAYKIEPPPPEPEDKTAAAKEEKPDAKPKGKAIAPLLIPVIKEVLEPQPEQYAQLLIAMNAFSNEEGALAWSSRLQPDQMREIKTAVEQFLNAHLLKAKTPLSRLREMYAYATALQHLRPGILEGPEALNPQFDWTLTLADNYVLRDRVLALSHATISASNKAHKKQRGKGTPENSAAAGNAVDAPKGQEGEAAPSGPGENGSGFTGKAVQRRNGRNTSGGPAAIGG